MDIGKPRSEEIEKTVTGLWPSVMSLMSYELWKLTDTRTYKALDPSFSGINDLLDSN